MAADSPTVVLDPIQKQSSWGIAAESSPNRKLPVKHQPAKSMNPAAPLWNSASPKPQIDCFSPVGRLILKRACSYNRLLPTWRLDQYQSQSSGRSAELTFNELEAAVDHVASNSGERISSTLKTRSGLLMVVTQQRINRLAIRRYAIRPPLFAQYQISSSTNWLNHGNIVAMLLKISPCLYFSSAVFFASQNPL